MPPSTTRITVGALKTLLAAAILAFLIFQARAGFSQLVQRSPSWPFLLAALTVSLAAVSMSFVRWHLLVRALKIDLHLIESVKLGALGYALNFVSLGTLGGDFYKAILLAYRHHGQRAEAVMTIVADRVMGLLTTLSVASAGILLTGLLVWGTAAVQTLGELILVATALGWGGLAVVILIDNWFGESLLQRASQIPWVGKMTARLLGVVAVYRDHKFNVLAAFLVSILSALGIITTFYLVARGLQLEAPAWSQHLVIVPVTGLVGTLPLTPSGLGTMEFVFEELYTALPGNAHVSCGNGTLTALGVRVTDIVVALLGLCFYLGHRQDVDEVLAETERLGVESKC